MKPTPNTLRGSFWRRSESTLALLLLLAALPFSHQAQAVTIDFETAPSSYDNLPLPFSENGFTFEEVGGGSDWQISHSSDAFMYGFSGTLRLKRTDNGFFDLQSLDVEFRNSVDALGTFGLVTSEGGTWDLSTVGNYTFTGVGFEGLSWVEMTIVRGELLVDNTSVDNIVVNNTPTTSVPDAGSTGLLLSGVLGMLGLCQRQLRRA